MLFQNRKKRSRVAENIGPELIVTKKKIAAASVPLPIFFQYLL